MRHTDPAAYGESFADVYDAWYADISDVDATVGMLAALAGDQPVLELGVGTGRIALPLAMRDLEVWGIDGSPPMLAQLRNKPGGTRVRAIEADMADFDNFHDLDNFHNPDSPDSPDNPAQPQSLDEPDPDHVPVGHFGLIFVAFNTFFNLDTVEAQQRCLAQVAAALVPGGAFVLEAFIPAPPPAHPDKVGASEYHEAERADGVGGTIRTESLHHPDDQIVEGVHHHTLASGAQRERPWRLRYAPPEQLDTMAAEVGLMLESRFADWDGRAITSTSERHISVYRTN